MKTRLLLLLGVAATLARAETTTNELGLTLSPGVRFVHVDGDDNRFRQDWNMQEGVAGGIENATLQRALGKDWQLTLAGRAVFDEEDYGVELQVAKPEVGFVRAGWKQYLTYEDDTGGFYRDFAPPALNLGEDLALRHGTIFVELGLRLPDLPKITVGYERQYRDGDKASLAWGSATQGPIGRKIVPSRKDVDETVDIIHAEIEHTIKNIRLADRFRYEYYRADNRRVDTAANLNVVPITTKRVTIREDYTYDSFHNTFVMDSHVNDRLYWSLGYLFTTLAGDGGLSLATVPFNRPFDKNWVARAIRTETDTHLVNLNGFYGPVSNLNFYAGIQAEKTDADGFTAATLTELAGGGVTNNPAALINSESDKNALEETLGVRYTGIPLTTVYAEGRWGQQWIDLDERATEDAVLALNRRTDTDVQRQDYRVGFSCSPIQRVTWSGRYRYLLARNDYDHEVDLAQGYPAFITGQRTVTDELMTRLNWRPCQQFALGLRYTHLTTAIKTGTDAIGALGVPAGTVRSGHFDSDVYSISATFTPVSRLYLTALVVYQDTATKAFDNGAASVATYEGDVLSFIHTMGYALDNKTDVAIEYSYSESNNRQNNTATSLPLGLDNERHALLASLTRQLTEHITGKLRYGYFHLTDDTQGGVDNYNAHLVSATCTLKF